jgi:hypothetical protein
MQGRPEQAERGITTDGMCWYVYVVTHVPTGRVYVGKARRPFARWNSHVAAARRHPTQRIHGAIRRCGVEDFSFRIVQELPTEEAAYEAERRWMAELHATESRHGYNQTEGGRASRPERHRSTRSLWLSVVTESKIERDCAG